MSLRGGEEREGWGSVYGADGRGKEYEAMRMLVRNCTNIPLKAPGAIEQLQMKRRRGLAIDLPAGNGLRGHYVLFPRVPNK